MTDFPHTVYAIVLGAVRLTHTSADMNRVAVLRGWFCCRVFRGEARRRNKKRGRHDAHEKNASENYMHDSPTRGLIRTDIPQMTRDQRER